MADPLWIPATLVASLFQVGRNALQRGVMGTAGPWGATLVRFLFGLPFSIAFSAVALTLVRDTHLDWSAAFWMSAAVGATSQVLATAALLMAMERAGFAVATALQQSSLPLAALLGLAIYGDGLSKLGWSGIAITTLGLAVLSWPAPDRRQTSIAGAGFGIASGLCFGLSLNAFRHAALALEPHHPLVAAIVSVAVVQAMQAAVLTLCLAWRAPSVLVAVLRAWRRSLTAGLCGALASTGWFMALALSPAAPVRALGIVEAPIAALAGRRLFRETLRPRQIAGGLAVVIGVVLTSLF